MLTQDGLVPPYGDIDLPDGTNSQAIALTSIDFY